MTQPETATPARPGDFLSIPVAMHRREDPAPAPWPGRDELETPGSVAAPVGGVPRVATCWRTLLHAAVTTGGPLPVPAVFHSSFAVSELMARLHTVTSTLGRSLDPDGAPVLRPSCWVATAADPTEVRAAGYRLGMTLANWLWHYQLGGAQTRHVDLLFGTDHPVRGRPNQKSADLFSRRWGASHHPWLIEAKASVLGFAIKPGTRRRAWAQLTAAAERGYPTPHGLALISTAASPLLHLVLEYATPPGHVPLAEPSAWPLSGWQPAPSARDLVVDMLLRRLLLESALAGPGAAARPVPGAPGTRLLEMPLLQLAVGLSDIPVGADISLRAVHAEVAEGLALATDLPPFSAEGRSWFVERVHDLVDRRLRDTGPGILVLDAFTTPVVQTSEIDEGPYRFRIEDPAGVVLLAGPAWSTLPDEERPG
ncbi:hypothetical protein [Actinoplanes teichomyceticus]|uniref:Uncharacterized protein n=1 Tax=Actinoplanes teichomyceticus TaxID=1867 RepID=A0A561VL62_ACTTI|nr:hypothetical protein [Actinoplanes teichomyceticus]TWG12356.1 hypothetical protein FHX34_105223 [Actinoplanes teichomyceticus]GIF13714.1 hypothetical protein Ate01nite_37460 [Actinoplanes teichomyceticus]